MASVVSSAQLRLVSGDERSFVFFSLLFKKLISPDSLYKTSFGYETRVISFVEKFNYLEKFKLASKFSIAFSFLRKTLFLNFFSRFSEGKIFINTQISCSVLHYFSLVFNINGNSLKGNHVTLFLPSFHMYTRFLSESLSKNQRSPTFVKFLDFFTFFRFQTSVKSICKILEFFFKERGSKITTTPHFLYLLERFFCLRGNDGSGTIMLLLENIKKKQLLDMIFFKIENFGLSEKSIKIFGKLILRLSVIGFPEKFQLEDITSLVSRIIKIFFKKSQNKLSIHYLSETLTFFVLNQEKIYPDLLKEIFQFGFIVITQEISQCLPYVFEIFSILLETQKDQLFCEFMEKLFSGLLTIHVWSTKELLRPMLKFINIFVSKKFFSPNITTIVRLLGIFEFLVQTNKEPEILFELFFSILDNQTIFSILVPHLIEMIFKKLENSKNEVLLFQFIILTMGIIGKGKAPFFRKATNKIRKNFSLYLFNFFCLHFSSLKSLSITNKSIDLILNTFLNYDLFRDFEEIKNLKYVLVRKFLYEIRFTGDHDKKKFTGEKESRIKISAYSAKGWIFGKLNTLETINKINLIV